MPIQTAVLKSTPGIKRDGTKFEGDSYTDGQWVRFQRGLPRKMGGYKTTQKFLFISIILCKIFPRISLKQKIQRIRIVC